MKKRLLSILSALLLIFIMLLPFCATAQSHYVVDEANLLTQSEEQELSEKLESFSEENDFDIVAVTVDSLGGKTATEFADDYYDYNGYKEDGCIFVISIEERDWSISPTGFGETAITEYCYDIIEENVVPYLRDGDYAAGLNKYADLVEIFVTSAKNGNIYNDNNTYTDENGKTYDYGSSNYDSEDDDDAVSGFIVSLIVSLIVAAIAVGMVKSSYKPVRFKASAADYLVNGSLKVTRSYEHFLYSNVTKTEIESSSSSRGGSSSHTSSSGASHSGRSGKF